MKFNNLIDLNLTQSSGQTSQPPWTYNNDTNTYCNVIISDQIPLLLKSSQNNINSFNLDYELPKNIDESVVNKNKIEKSIKSEISKIYDLNFDLEKFYKFLKDDEKLSPSCDFSKGLRLFRATDPFEAIISSISSSNNSIKRWVNSINDLKKIWGDEFEFPSGKFYKFPPSEILFDAYEDNLEEYEASTREMEIECYTNNLKSCGFGYRVPYIKDASEVFTFKYDYNELFNMSYEEAYDEIIKIKGVGPKVADCILLYGFGFFEAFPSDVWIKRIVSYLYFDNNQDISIKELRQFGMDTFGKYAGYVQLYLFNYGRTSGLFDELNKK